MLTEEQATEYMLKHVDELTEEQLRLFVTQYIAALKKMRELTQQLADAMELINKHGLQPPKINKSAWVN